MLFFFLALLFSGFSLSSAQCPRREAEAFKNCTIISGIMGDDRHAICIPGELVHYENFTCLPSSETHAGLEKLVKGQSVTRKGSRELKLSGSILLKCIHLWLSEAE